MTQTDERLWDSLAEKHPRALITTLRDRIERDETFELDSEKLVAATEYSEQEGRDVLEALAEHGLLAKQLEYVCACNRNESLSVEEARAVVCARCGEAFKERERGAVAVVENYSRHGSRTRDVRWVLALHGMNTRGAWQESFNWLISRTYGYSVPVAIYKYGVVRPGAILRFRQRALTRQLISRIRRLSGESAESGFGGVPDVIAHSLGTWLLGHALDTDRSLHAGRVILVGSILRPDFNWGKLIERGQVEAVLCHYSTGDFWARIAHYVIPKSGPSGRRGFNDRDAIAHVETKDLSHSGYFDERKMLEFHGSVWKRFLTDPPSRLKTMPRLNISRPWREAWWPFRATLPRYLVLLLFASICTLFLAALVLGGWEVFFVFFGRK